MSPKYSLSRRVTAGESSTRNFLMPGVYKIQIQKNNDTRKVTFISSGSL